MTSEIEQLRARIAELEAQLAAGGEAVSYVLCRDDEGDEYMAVPARDYFIHPQPAAPAGVPEGYVIVSVCLIQEIVDLHEKCYYDHHGYCQSHNLHMKGDCWVEKLQAALSAAPNTQEKGGA